MVIDGGKGQLSAAIKGMAKAGVFPIATLVSEEETPTASPEGMCVQLAVCALAKNEEEVFIPGRTSPVNQSPDSPALLLLRSIRDESHRFALTAHRKRRSIQKST